MTVESLPGLAAPAKQLRDAQIPSCGVGAVSEPLEPAGRRNIVRASRSQTGTAVFCPFSERAYLPTRTDPASAHARSRVRLLCGEGPRPPGRWRVHGACADARRGSPGCGVGCIPIHLRRCGASRYVAVRLAYVRNVEVVGSSPITSTRVPQVSDPPSQLPRTAHQRSSRVHRARRCLQFL
jgi:hypothetical protein